MLGVFQQVATQITNHAVGDLATFDLMFEGIRSALKTQIQRSILTAEGHLDNHFAVQVLKALFLVKYVKEFKATPRNISVLMLNSFDTDLPALHEEIDEALRLLERQTYIQRNGEQYEFLTDEEKDIEQEIKNTEVETAVVAEELGKIIFDVIIKDRKIRDENGQDYPFSRKLDDRLLGREYELAIHVISPFHEHIDNETILRSRAMGRDELLVIMPPSDRLVSDLLMYKRTDKYIRQNVSTTQQDTVRRILNDKLLQNQSRYGALQGLVSDLLGEAALIVSGQDVEVENRDPETRIIRGFYELLLRTYPNRRMLRGANYTENDITIHLTPDVTLFGDDGAMVSEPEQEMLAFVQGNERTGQRTTLSAIVDRFEHKPYGWYLAAIQCILAKLFARGKIEAYQDGTPLEDEALERAIRNTHGYSNVVLAPQIDFTATQIRRLKEFYGDFFDTPPQNNEAKGLGKETAQAFQTLVQELTHLQSQADKYTFLSALDEPITQLSEFTRQQYTFYLTDLHRNEDFLFELKEQVLDPIRRFMHSAQREIYNEAQSLLRDQEPNFSYIEGNDVQQLREILDNPECYRGDRMQQARILTGRLREQVNQQVQAEIADTVRKIDERWQRLTGMAEFELLDDSQTAQLQRPFDELERSIQRHTLIAVLRDMLHRFDEGEYQRLLRQMTDWAHEAVRPPDAGDEQPPAPDYEIVSRSALHVAFNKALLADENDVADYLAALESALLEEIRNGRRIQI